MIKVAFWYDRPAQYSGGLNYLRNLLHALSCLEDSPIQPYIFFGKAVDADLLQPFERLATVVRTSILDRKSVAWFAHQILHRLFGSLLMVQLALRPHGISIVSHAAVVFGRRRPFRIISWIPDFQYLHLPELFPDDAQKYSKQVLAIAEHTDALVLSSFAALSDFKRVAADKIATSVLILQFVSQPAVSRDGSQRLTAESIYKQYGISGQYFLMPNQFWKHKNHRLVFEAVETLRSRGVNVVVVCTGNLRDYRVRESRYADELLQFVEERKLRDNIKILGQIDHAEVLFLMRNCISVINPSRFEGWSSTVEEARSMGQRVMLSRIPVHLEQNPKNASYFDLQDSTELADMMADRWAQGQTVISEGQKSEALVELQKRTIDYARAYVKLVVALDSGMLEKRVYEDASHLPAQEGSSMSRVRR